MKKYLMRAAALAALAVLTPAAAFAQSAAADDSVYQALGGNDGIRKIAKDLVAIMLADARIKDAFKDVDIDHLAQRLAEQFCELSGGPCKYRGKNMSVIHADLAITNAKFNAVAEDLQMAMERLGVSSSAQNKLLAKLAPMQRDIVTK